jgi:hypothetical protein
MEQENQKPQRQGLHKYFHVSKLDTYFYLVLSLGFFVLVGFKVANRFFDWGMSTAYINWKDAMQLAILWGILALVSDMYYEKYERKYKK